MKVLWTDAAIAQLQAINDYIAQTSLEYARRVVDRLTKRCIQIADLPYAGRRVPEYDLNEVREIIERPYRIIYLVKEAEDQIEVLAVIHGARKGLKPLG